jgi:hypothetical protein
MFEDLIKRPIKQQIPEMIKLIKNARQKNQDFIDKDEEIKQARKYIFRQKGNK